MSPYSPLGDAVRQPALFTRQADALLREASRTGQVQAAFGAVERALENSFEAALHAALQPSPARGAPPVAAAGAAGPVGVAGLPAAPVEALAASSEPGASPAAPAMWGAGAEALGGLAPSTAAASALETRELAPWRSAIAEAADRHGVPAWLVANVVRQESGGNAQATSASGAMGLMQLMPGTAAELGVKAPYDGRQNLDGGVRYLARMIAMFDGDLTRAVAADNAGPGYVAR